MLESEGLARACFEAGRDPDFPRRFKELLHPDVSVLMRTRGNGWLHGFVAVSEALDQLADAPVYEAIDESYRPIDDERVIVEGRLRWMDETRVLRDDPVVWGLEFKDGLLHRSLATRSIVEAEAALAAERQRA